MKKQPYRCPVCQHAARLTSKTPVCLNPDHDQRIDMELLVGLEADAVMSPGYRCGCEECQWRYRINVTWY